MIDLTTSPNKRKKTADAAPARHHPGELEAEYQAQSWWDWDEPTHGEIDSFANRREYPEGFRWSCCDLLGNEVGCTEGEGESIDQMYATSEGPSDVELESGEEEHDGELEADDDAWPDHEEGTHGPVDTKTNRRNRPEAFVWNCCGKTGAEGGGCTRAPDGAETSP